MPEYNVQLQTTHGQFYLRDEEFLYCGEKDNFWSKPALRRRLAITKCSLGIGTLQACPHDLRVQPFVGKRCPRPQIAACPHVVQCSIQCRSGKISLEPCCTLNDDERFLFALAPGWYRVCILYAWDETADYNYSEVPESYRVYLWPEKWSPLEFTKGKVWNSRMKAYRDV